MDQSRNFRVLILQAHIVVSAAILVLAPAYTFLGLEAEALVYPLSLLFVALVIWIAWSWTKVAKTLFEPYFIFIVAAACFNGGRILLEAFDLNDHGLLGSLIAVDFSFQSAYLVVVGMAAVHLGALVCVAQSPSTVYMAGDHRLQDERTARAARFVAFGLFALSVVPAFIVLRENVQIAASQGYAGLFGREGAATGFGSASNVLFLFWVPAALFLLSGSRNSKTLIAISLSAVGIYAVINFAVGTRGPAVMSLLAVLWLYDRIIARVPRKMLFVGGGCLVALMPLIAVVRSKEGSERFSVEKVLESFDSINNPITAGISEAGGSQLTVAYTVNLVPSVRDFDWGASYLYALTTAVPNLGWELHPAVAHGLLGDWLIKTVDPETARRGGGLGYSFIAEAYLNFGWLGSPIALGLIGFGIVKLSIWSESGHDPARVALVASFLSFFVWFARSESGTIFRALLWYAAVPYLFVRLFTKRGPTHRKDEVVSWT